MDENLIKAVAGCLALLLLIPMLTFTAIPNIFFGYEGSGNEGVSQMSRLAISLGGIYMSLEDYENTLVDSIVSSIMEALKAQSIIIGVVEIERIFDENDLDWFIAIISVACQQDLDTISVQDVLAFCAFRLIHEYTLLGEQTKVLKVTVKHLGPDRLMEFLGFDEERRTWAGAIFEVLSGSGAIEEHASYFW